MPAQGALGKAYGVESHVLSPAETKALYPLMNVDDLYGTLYVPHDGTMDPAGTCTALTRAAAARGAQIIENCPVTGIRVRTDDFGVRRVAAVETEHGSIQTPCVVNCAAPEAVTGPSARHRRFHHLLTDHRHWIRERSHESYAKNYSVVFPHDEPLAGRNMRTDPLHEELLAQGCVFQERQGWERPGWFTPKGTAPVLRYDYYGAYGNRMHEDHAYGRLLGDEYTFDFPPHHDVIKKECLACRGAAAVFNMSYFGKFYLVGLDARKAADWLFSADVSRPPGSTVYTCMLNHRGGTESDLTVSRLAPSPQASALAPAFEALTKSLYGKTDAGSRRSQEVKEAGRTSKISRPEPHFPHLENGDLPEGAGGSRALTVRGAPALPGRGPEQAVEQRLGPELRPQDPALWVFDEDSCPENAGPGSCPGTRRPRPSAWPRRQLQAPAPAGKQAGKTPATPQSYGGAVLLEDRSRAILQEVLDADLSDEAFPFSTHKLVRASGHLVRAMRLSFVGELGWELHVPKPACVPVYRAVMAAGTKHGLVNAGYRAIDSLSIEKGYRHWHADLRPDDSPLEAGLAFTCKLKSAVPFLGREALEKQRAEGLRRRLVCFTVDEKVPMFGLEAIWRNGQVVGHVRRADFGFAVDKTLAYGYIRDPSGQSVSLDFVKSGDYALERMGVAYPARAHLKSPFDPDNKRVKGIY
ncbi:sarcosine dehydrogenase, mitochondrial [Puma concolor]|uniref:Sarcosine dehydrogenase, mitochondrial n=1 Tax=Puma concolor TaxID=9696 RepID=A0A6P6HVG2_PUMCO|nr:sarcosine dehydrogenase, mitochondrial [Puma concolor]